MRRRVRVSSGSESTRSSSPYRQVIWKCLASIREGQEGSGHDSLTFGEEQPPEVVGEARKIDLRVSLEYFHGGSDLELAHLA